MNLKVIHDSKGKAKGVCIPVKQWKELKKQYKNLAVLAYDKHAKEQILQKLKEAGFTWQRLL